MAFMCEVKPSYKKEDGRHCSITKMLCKSADCGGCKLAVRFESFTKKAETDAIGEALAERVNKAADLASKERASLEIWVVKPNPETKDPGYSQILSLPAMLNGEKVDAAPEVVQLVAELNKMTGVEASYFKGTTTLEYTKTDPIMVTNKGIVSYFPNKVIHLEINL
jgi:hypothetical protein